jgi:hypothetical protein
MVTLGLAQRNPGVLVSFVAVLAILLLAGGQAVISVPSVHAAACGPQVNSFDGISSGNKTGTTPAYGTFANITTSNPTLCTGTGGDSSVWTMLSGDVTCQYAQVGYVKQQAYGDTAPHEFAEAATNCSNGVISRNPATVSGTHSYRTSYIQSVGRVWLYFDEVVVAQTGFDPLLYWNAPWHSYWSGETLHTADDMPGTSSAPVYFDGLKRKETVNGSWVTPSSTPALFSNGCSCYKKAWDTQRTKFHIWTQR